MTERRRRILAISGSTKKQSTSRRLLEYVAKSFENEIQLTIYDGIGHLPHFNPDLEKEHLPESVDQFRALIAQAEGVLFCTPEYVFSLPGSLKNAIEWTVSTTLFSSKPVAMIVAAASGEKAYESLGLIMTTLESVLPEDAKLLIKGAKGKIREDLAISDQRIVAGIHRVMHSLVHTIEQKITAPTKYQ